MATRQYARHRALLRAFVGLFALSAYSQYQGEQPSSLVKFLTRPIVDDGHTICAITEEGQARRAAANALVRQGSAALPAIEDELDRIKNVAARADFSSGWLFYAYAKIKRRAAFPRLWELITTEPASYPFAGLGPLASDSMALALDLTSYVPDNLPLTRIFHCGPPQPRDTLNQFILAWERDDREWFSTSLGPDAAAELKWLSKEKTWTEMRAALWPSKTSNHAAVGYRFVLPGPYSLSDMDVLDSYYADSNIIDSQNPKLGSSLEFLVPTRFTDKTGKDCGKLKIKFLVDSHPGPPGYLSFLVDSSDVVALLHIIGSCAAQ